MHVARQLYFAFVYSKISYGLEIMTNCSAKNINKVQILQNKLIKLILKLDRLTPTNYVHQKLKILKVVDIQVLKLICLVSKCLLGKCPPCFSNYFTWRTHIYNLREVPLLVMRSRTVLGATNTRIYAAKIYNSLPEKVKILRHQNNFKKIVAGYLREQYV